MYESPLPVGRVRTRKHFKGNSSVSHTRMMGRGASSRPYEDGGSTDRHGFLGGGGSGSTAAVGFWATAAEVLRRRRRRSQRRRGFWAAAAVDHVDVDIGDVYVGDVELADDFNVA
jgi:hypothetical protein